MYVYTNIHIHMSVCIYTCIHVYTYACSMRESYSSRVHRARPCAYVVCPSTIPALSEEPLWRGGASTFVLASFNYTEMPASFNDAETPRHVQLQ